MKAILLSVQPKWVEKILNGEKTIEIRKTAPKCELPVEVYVYCTYGQCLYSDYRNTPKGELPVRQDKLADYNVNRTSKPRNALNGKVVAKFTLRETEAFTTDYRIDKAQTERICQNACIEICDARDYEINGSSPCLYAWHISDLQIFDKHMELGEFETQCEYDKKPCDKTFKEVCGKCENFRQETFEPCECLTSGRIKLTRPPQSYCYVEVSDA